MRTLLLAAFVLSSCSNRPPTGACHDYFVQANGVGQYCPHPSHTVSAAVAEDEHVIMCRCPRLEPAAQQYQGECQEYVRREDEL